MDVLYEESAVNANAAKGEKRYKILNLFTWFFGVLALIFAILFVIGLVSFLMAMSAMKAEDRATAIGSLIFYFMMITLFGGPWLACFLMKRKINVSFDYTFVSGELRISKVFNVNRRKFLYRIDAESIQKMGDTDSPSFDRVISDPSVKKIVCTPNAEPSGGKFFLYIVTSESGGRRVYILECREELLINILKFVKRGILESDYVMQEKKAQKHA
ncbi:MAG: hypothetical protein MRZ13_06195 [Clostridiales bacterium]|nr:hypothetical protein [Clostridiales bacterium]MDY4895113.1 hypothetical protein [Christensenellaceae bacterium]